MVMVEDYQKPNGDWAKAKKIAGKTHQTLSGAKWFGLLRRCYDREYHKTHPNYADVENGFLCFQDFAEWHMAQIGYASEDWHLDKDLLVKGNKRYSPETCILLPRELNSMIVWKSKNRDGLPTGVTAHHRKYVASWTHEGKNVYAGLYSTVEEAFAIYKTRKEIFIKQQANKWKDKIDPRAYNALMNYEVCITD